MSTQPTPSLTARLKADNWDMHQIAEQGHGQGSVLRGELSLPGYLELIDQGYLVHHALDQAAKAAAKARPEFTSLFADEHLLSPHYARDLAHFGVAPENIDPISGSERFIAHIESVAGDPLAVLGLHYVRTGASNGNKFAVNKARETYSLPDTGEGTAHLDPYGDAQRQSWGAFKVDLDKLQLSQAEQDAVVASARRMYELFICWHTEDDLNADQLLAKHGGKLNKSDFDRAHAASTK